MSNPAAVHPFINGHRFSFASIEISLLGHQFFGVSRIAYGSTLKPGVIRGSDTEIVGRTPGEVEHRCEVEMYQEDGEELIKALGPGFGLVPFDVIVMFAEELPYNEDPAAGKTSGVTTHTLLDCRISSIDLSGSDSVDANTIRFSLEPISIGYGDINRSINWRPEIASHVPVKEGR